MTTHTPKTENRENFRSVPASVNNIPDSTPVNDRILTAILTDRLDEARALLLHHRTGLESLAHLLDRIPSPHTPPLAGLEGNLPRVLQISVSYTCGIGCKMCYAGFADRTVLYEDYKYLDPVEFGKLGPWIESATHVVFIGAGETLDSPLIYDFISTLERKTTILYTSGVPLNREKARKLIRKQEIAERRDDTGQ